MALDNLPVRRAGVDSNSLGGSYESLAERTLNTQTDDYTLVIGDAVKKIIMNKASAVTLTIPANASVAFATGTRIPVRNIGAGLLTIAITSDTITNSAQVYISPTGGTCTLVKTAATAWYIEVSPGGTTWFINSSGNMRTPGSLIVAGSEAQAFQFTYASSGTHFIKWGTGSPESAVTAPVGSLFLRTDGGANTTLYVKESGSGNTGWVAK